MANIKIPNDWEVSENETTPESVFMDRRKFLKGTGTIALFSAISWAGCAPSANSGEPATPVPVSESEKAIYPAKLDDSYTVDGPITPEKISSRYNNFYEFSSDKEGPRYNAQVLKTRPWKLEIKGHVENPGVYDMDDLYKTMPMEERIYRLRCVEAWSMMVPWTGFPLKALIDKVKPKSSATHVAFTTFYRPFSATGQLAFWYPWAYTEGLRVEEAMNKLTFMAVGIYGHPLPKQHGAPIRLVVPWKYGYKSAKSIEIIEFLDYQPPTFWTTAQPLEYAFEGNVNPGVPHPRWSQGREKMIGTGRERLTQIHNGYGRHVAHLY